MLFFAIPPRPGAVGLLIWTTKYTLSKCTPLPDLQLDFKAFHIYAACWWAMGLVNGL